MSYISQAARFPAALTQLTTSGGVVTLTRTGYWVISVNADYAGAPLGGSAAGEFSVSSSQYGSILHPAIDNYNSGTTNGQFGRTYINTFNSGGTITLTVTSGSATLTATFVPTPANPQ